MFQLDVPASPAGALPSVTFDNALHLWHNGDSLDLVHFDPAHTDTDIYIHFHKANVLHVGDIWFNGFYPFIDEGTGGSIGGMIHAAEKALAVADNSTKIIPGHGPLGSKADLQKFHDMLAGCSRQGDCSQSLWSQRAGSHRQEAHSGLRCCMEQGHDESTRQFHRPGLPDTLARRHAQCHVMPSRWHGSLKS